MRSKLTVFDKPNDCLLRHAACISDEVNPVSLGLIWSNISVSWGYVQQERRIPLAETDYTPD